MMKKSKNKILFKLLSAFVAGFLICFRRGREFERIYQIVLPHAWGFWLKFFVLITLKEQVYLLQKGDHWDKQAIRLYIKKILNSSDETTVFQHCAATFEQTQQVGSEIYTSMYLGSRLKAKKKLRLVLRHLGAMVDDNGFLKLNGTHKFAKNLSPHADFYAAFREDVCRTYSGTDGLNTDILGQRLHLFRSWIDLQNIKYIRQNFIGATDFEKLQDYARSEKQPLDLTTNAAFHNRFAQTFNYPQNMKVQVPATNTVTPLNLNNARMAEFIINITTESFVSEWNVYRDNPDGRVDADPQHYSSDQLYQIANTESFNYGIPKGQQHDLPAKDHTHFYIDVQHPADSQVRQVATHTFHSPRPVVASVQYVDLIKHLSDVAAWQKVPVGQRQEIYQDYTRFCREYGEVVGFESYWST